MEFLLAVLFVIAASNGAPLFPYVVDYSGPSTAYCVERASKCLMPAPLFPLQAGDRVRVVQASSEEKGGSTISLWVEGALQVVDAHNSPFCVGRVDGRCNGSLEAQTQKSVSSSQERLLGSLGAMLRDANGDAHAPDSPVRGLERPPLLAMLRVTPRARTIPTPELRFAWLGGAAPFQVSLRRGSKSIAQRSGVSANEERFSGLRLSVGTYALRVTDRSGRSDMQSFDVIAPRKLPVQEARDAAALQTLPAQIAAVVRAAWLAKHGPQWYLAAYEALNAAPADFPPAAQLRFYLTEGP